MDVGATEFFGSDVLTGGCLDQRRAAQEDCAGAADDDGLVAHRRNVGAAGGARAHDGRDLRDALGAHTRLIEEDAPEMLGVGEHFVLQRQERPAGVNQVDAR